MPPKAATGAAAPKTKAKAVKKEKNPEDDVPVVPQPDRAELDAALAEVQTVIDGYKKKQDDLSKQIHERSAGKDEFFTKKGELKAQLDEFTQRINDLLETKKKLGGEIDQSKQEGTKMKNELKNMQQSIGYKSEEEIDQRIRDIEFQMSTSSMKLSEEKALMKEIAELKKNRPKVKQVNTLRDSLDARDFGSNAKTQIEAIKAQVNVYRDAKTKVQEKFTELMEERKGQLGNLPDIIAQRDALSVKVKEELDKRNKLRDEFKEKERAFNQYKNEIRAKRAEMYAEERKKMSEEREQKNRLRQVEKLDEQPHIDEITLIEQTMLFCKGLTGEKEEKKEVEKKEVEHNLVGEKKEALEVMVKKEDKEEFFFVPTKAKKTKGSKNKGSKEGASAKPIKHNAETFKLFDKLKIDAPITTDDIPNIMVKLEALLADYKQKVADWEQNREELKRKILEGGEEEKEAAAEEKAEETAE